MSDTPTLTGVLRQCAILYRELLKAQISPVEADKMELWQIASLLGEDESSDDPEVINRRMLEERARAHHEGRDLDAESMVTPMDMDGVRRVLGDSDNRGVAP